MVGGLVYQPHPVTKAAVRELADGYNKGLRRDLGLIEGSARRSKQPRLRLHLFADRDRGGLAISGTFWSRRGWANTATNFLSHLEPGWG